MKAKCNICSLPIAYTSSFSLLLLGYACVTTGGNNLRKKFLYMPLFLLWHARLNLNSVSHSLFKLDLINFRAISKFVNLIVVVRVCDPNSVFGLTRRPAVRLNEN